jgi:hypothetical protein
VTDPGPDAFARFLAALAPQTPRGRRHPTLPAILPALLAAGILLALAALVWIR